MLWAGLILALVALSAATAFVIAPRIDRLQRDTPTPIAALEDTDPRKVAFGRLHGLSTALMVVTVVAGAGLIWMETQDR